MSGDYWRLLDGATQPTGEPLQTHRHNGFLASKSRLPDSELFSAFETIKGIQPLTHTKSFGQFGPMSSELISTVGSGRLPQLELAIRNKTSLRFVEAELRQGILTGWVQIDAFGKVIEPDRRIVLMRPEEARPQLLPSASYIPGVSRGYQVGKLTAWYDGIAEPRPGTAVLIGSSQALTSAHNLIY